MSRPVIDSFVSQASGAVISGHAEHVARARQRDHDRQAEQVAWIAALRGAGVKAAHPDDGWVNRERNTVHLAYPQFNDGLSVGDLLALGWPGDEVDRERGVRRTRLVRVTGSSPNRFAHGLTADAEHWYWHFEEVSA